MRTSPPLAAPREVVQAPVYTPTPSEAARIVQKFTATMYDERRVGHDGVDFAVPPDGVIIAIADGTVLSVSSGDGPTGQLVTVLHREHVFVKELNRVAPVARSFMYAHLRAVRVRVGDTVTRGQVIGEPWNPQDGIPWESHVHLQYIDAKAPVERRNPFLYVRGCLSSAPAGAFVFPVPC